MKRKYFHQKLVRDKIPQAIKATGDTGRFKILSPKAFEKELKKKLIEESKEVANASGDSVLDELADVLEIVKSIASHYKIRFSRVEKHQEEKRNKRGSFKKKLFLVWSTGKAGK